MSTETALWSKANLKESKFRHQSARNTFRFIAAVDRLSHIPIPLLHNKAKCLKFTPKIIYYASLIIFTLSNFALPSLFPISNIWSLVMVTDYEAHHDYSRDSKAACIPEIDCCLLLGSALSIFLKCSHLPVGTNTYKGSQHATGNVKHKLWQWAYRPCCL